VRASTSGKIYPQPGYHVRCRARARAQRTVQFRACTRARLMTRRLAPVSFFPRFSSPPPFTCDILNYYVIFYCRCPGTLTGNSRPHPRARGQICRARGGLIALYERARVRPDFVARARARARTRRSGWVGGREETGRGGGDRAGTAYASLLPFIHTRIKHDGD
jgi:hypothetical protein